MNPTNINANPPSTLAAGSATRSAWLIENGKPQGHGLKYMTFDPANGMFVWVEDVHAALHLSRRRDAELLSQESDEAERIVEHGFIEPNH